MGAEKQEPAYTAAPAEFADPIKMDTDTYEKYMGLIEASSEGLLEDTDYVEPDTNANHNAVIPDYATADHRVIDTIKKFMTAQELVVQLMKNVETNYVNKVDQNKAKELADAASQQGG